MRRFCKAYKNSITGLTEEMNERKKKESHLVFLLIFLGLHYFPVFSLRQ